MSVCRYNGIYYPMLKRLQNTLDDTSFRKYIEDHFINPEEIYNIFYSGGSNSSTVTPIVETIPYSSRTGKVETTGETTQKFYTTSSRYDKMKLSFRNRIVESSIYDMHSQTFINANDVCGESTILNAKLLNYKQELLATIKNFLGTSENDYEAIIQEFKSKMLNADLNDAYYVAYDAYVTLRNFDELLEKETPWIKVNTAYKDFFSPFRYIYVGPQVNHYTGFSNNEHAGQEESVGKLVKILLDYLPEYNRPNTSISLPGFNSVMMKIKLWAENNTNPEIITEWNKEAACDMNKIIKAYIADTRKPREYRTYETGKLLGILNYIYSNNMDPDVQRMFTHLIHNTVLSSYYEYEASQQMDDNKMLIGNKVVHRNLTARPVNIQATELQNIANGAIEYWKANKSGLQQIVDKWNIIRDQYNIYITDPETKKTTIVSIKGDSIITNGEINNIDQLIYDVALMLLPDNIQQIVNEIYTSPKKTITSLYMPVIGYILSNAITDSNKGLVGWPLSLGGKRDLARVLSTINGSDITSVIKDANGNNLPLYQMQCLAYNHKKMFNRISEQSSRDNIASIYNSNIIFQNIQNIKAPIIRSKVNVNGSIKDATALNANDVMYLAIADDFYRNLIEKQSNTDEGASLSGIIGLQAHVYSDKNRHFIMQFDLNQDWIFDGQRINFKKALTDYIITGKERHLKPILDVWYKSNQQQLNTQIQNIINDYNKVFGINLQSIEELKAFIEKNKAIIKSEFRKNGIEFIEEIHMSNGRFNETLEYLYNSFSSEENFNKFVNKRFAQFKNNLDGVRTTLALDRGITHSVDNILFAYFITDSFLSNEYNKMMVGEVYSHPNKNKLGEKEAEQAIRNRLGKEFNKLTPEQKNAAIAEELIDYAVASRWIAQVKRMVIYGATYHGYAQGEKYGVPEEINMAVINDFGANVYNIIGQSNENDSMDGSGYTSPYLSRMQYVSLMDAAIPSHNKTIYSDINARYGTPKLLKWAEYEITNAIRRQKGDIRLENIFKKMHNISFNTFAYEQDFDDLYYFDENAGSYYQIKHISIDADGNAIRTIIPVNKSGRAAGEAFQQKFDLVINTIYNLDQLFGGAYACKIHDATNNLQWSEHNQDYVNKIICENNLKDKMIGWLVNKSAIKVGASNVNSNSAWIDDTELIFTKMSSKFGGLQMNAEHDLDESDVTEASQMISALEQNGYTHDIAISIYKELGQFCVESLSEIQSAINSTDQDLLYQIFGKAVIQAFQSGTKDTLGLAQSFVTLATNSMKDNKIQYHIPFSSSSINGIFNSTVTTNIIKKAIRRHYAGVSAVLNPSHNVMVYHEIDGKRYRSDELYDIVQHRLAENNLSGLGITINDCLSKVYLDDAQDIMNPFLEVISDPLSIDFEDTIVISSFEGDEVIKIDTFEKYEYYRNNMPNDVTYLKWTIRPKNLKGANTTFNWMDDNGVQHVDSVFNSTSQKLLYYVFNNDELIKSIKNKKISIDEFINIVNNIIKKRYEKHGIISEADPTLIENLREYLKSYTEITPTILDTVKTQLTRKQQLLLHNLSEGKSINWNGVNIQPINVQVNTAQIAIGKLYAKQLGLLPGDSIGKIREQGSDFFKNRIMGYYNNPVQNKNAYDWVLYDGTGKKLYVKLGKTDLPVLANDNYQNIEGRIYLDGKDLYSTDGKQFYTFVENDTEYDLVVVDSIDRFRELRNGHFVHVERNYESNNRAVIVREEYGSDDSDLITINGRNIAEYDIDTLMQQLNSNQFNKLNKKIDKLAQAKYEAFEKSLTFIGTRIPCQSMQSFSAMEAVVFTDSETNEIYVPVNIMWLEGSDLDIDKQYVMGYSVSDNGYIITEPKENSPYYMKEMALKNRIVSKIHQVILNPKNQINLTQPVTVDQVKALAEKSSMGLAARYMNGWDPSSKYRMQIENMVGKNVIGNVATAIKSFFALSNLYNTKFREIYNLILSGQYNEARNMLSKYTFTRNGRLATLANVNLEMFAEFENMVFPDDQKDLQQTLLTLKYNEDLIEDQSMILGALLNSATDFCPKNN